MASTLHHLVREEPEVLLSMEPEELASPVLQCLIKREDGYSPEPQSREGLLSEFARASIEVRKMLTEAWVWLEQEGCIAPHPNYRGDKMVFVTRRGRQLAMSPDVFEYRRVNLLPKQFLHPVIAQKAWSAFIRGDYDVAVLQAFKQVEVAVRSAGSFSAGDYGTDLMRQAFNIDKGPLTNRTVLAAERQALSDLFAGAIGLYKNPHSHRNVPISDPQEAAEMIILASHLLKIVDSRAPGQVSEPKASPA